MALSPQEIAGAAQAAGFPPAELATATAVALAESGGDPAATNRNTNGSYDYGLWQINTVHGPLLSQGNRFDPVDNAKMAYTVWQRAGNKWTPWVTYKMGTYRVFMPKATLGAAAPTAPSVAAGSAPAVDDPTSGPVDSVTNAIGGLSSSIGENFKAFNDMLKRLISGGFWLRVAAFAVGVMLIGFSMIKMSGADKAAMKLGKAGVTVASRGVL
jgi:hypothetical protein